MVSIEKIRCKGCGICIEFCPKNCLKITDEINSKGYRVVGLTDETKCAKCGVCTIVCPDIAITLHKD